MRNEEIIQSVQLEPQAELSELSTEVLEEMAEAGQEVFEIHRLLSKTGDNVVGELLKNQGTFYEWDHYPPGDVYDRETHAQYYYHAHAVDQRFDGEHGHFHTFLRPKGMPKGIKPAKVPGYVKPDDPDDALSHLIAISMTPSGFPFRLFTTNRWITGEVWYSGEDVCRLLPLFLIDHTQPSWPVNRWVSAMVKLYRPQIEELVHARDRTISAAMARSPEEDIFEDRSLEVTSFLDIDLEKQVHAVAAALLERQD